MVVRSPPLWSEVMAAHFHWEGKWERASKELMMEESG